MRLGCIPFEDGGIEKGSQLERLAYDLLYLLHALILRRAMGGLFVRYPHAHAMPNV